MTPTTPEDRAATGPPGARRARPRWQIGLRGLGLVLLAVALWLTVVANRREIARLEGRIATLRPIARELVIADPSRFAAVLREPRWQGEDRWDVHVPAGSYRLCLATRGVEDGQPGPGGPDSLAPVVRSLPIGPGRHRVELDFARGDGPYRIAFGVDGGPRERVEEPKEWGSDGSMGGGPVHRERPGRGRPAAGPPPEAVHAAGARREPDHAPRPDRGGPALDRADPGPALIVRCRG